MKDLAERLNILIKLVNVEFTCATLLIFYVPHHCMTSEGSKLGFQATLQFDNAPMFTKGAESAGWVLSYTQGLVCLYFYSSP